MQNINKKINNLKISGNFKAKDKEHYINNINNRKNYRINNRNNFTNTNRENISNEKINRIKINEISNDYSESKSAKAKLNSYSSKDKNNINSHFLNETILHKFENLLKKPLNLGKNIII